MITVLTNGRLLDCVGNEPREDMSIVVEEGKIKDIYSGNRPLSDKATVISVGGKTIIPGLTDAHGHNTFTGYGRDRYNKPPIIQAAVIMQNLRLDLQAGFTTICGYGGPNWALKHACEQGIIEGPRFLVACSTISKTGGHGDFSNFRDGLGEWYAKDTGLIALDRIADGVDECRKAAREQLRNGADIVKIMVTGGAEDYNANMEDAAYSEEEIRAFVEEADDNGKYVVAHALTIRGIKRAIKCGVRSIQHGVSFDEEAARMLKEKGAYYVPTLLVLKRIKDQGRKFGAPEDFIRKVTAIFDESIRSAELTHRLGCNVGFGTGCGEPWSHGMQGIEFKLKTECGMTPYEAIKSATVVNAKLFGMSDKIGTIEINKWADIVVTEGHPEEDIALLGDPNNIRLVMKGGKVVKNILSR